MRKIAVLSDTHDLLRPEVLERIRTCDGLIHGGDINSQRVIDEILKNMKPRSRTEPSLTSSTTTA